MLAPAAIDNEPAPASEPHFDFDALYAEYFDFVWRNLRRLGIPESGMRDAAQEVFLVIHRRLGEFVPQGTLRSWIYSILRRVAFAQRRQYRRYVNDDTDGIEGLAGLADITTRDPETDAVHGQSLRLMLTLLEGLDDDKRDALVIVDIEGMSVPEACLALDVNPNTLYSRLRAARHQMRHRYEIYARGDDPRRHATVGSRLTYESTEVNGGFDE